MSCRNVVPGGECCCGHAPGEGAPLCCGFAVLVAASGLIPGVVGARVAIVPGWVSLEYLSKVIWCVRELVLIVQAY